MMDPERLRSYLQVACSGLGFDIGEVWWTSNGTSPSSCPSTAGAIESSCSAGPYAPRTETEITSPCHPHAKHVRFVQLYTSRSYEDKRSQLVSPSKKLTDRLFQRRKPWDGDDDDEEDPILNDEEAKDVKRHVLSPRLVDAIAASSQVVWANCQRREGLLGRSDMLLQTAVGLPVAMDSRGHMCVVVMFSPCNVQSNDDAMDYLQFISKCAMSTSIPCLYPVLKNDPENNGQSRLSPVKLNSGSHLLPPQDLGEGVVARFVSFRDSRDDTGSGGDSQNGLFGASSGGAEVHVVHEVMDAPKDCYGIPMLPSHAEMGVCDDAEGDERSNSPLSSCSSEAFDEASFGVWSTVMHAPVDDGGGGGGSSIPVVGRGVRSDSLCMLADSTTAAAASSRRADPPNTPSPTPRNGSPKLSPQKRERLEEFASAFLGMSVFDMADVWMPSISDVEDSEALHHIASITSKSCGDYLEDFIRVSSRSTVKTWTGAVGRAFGSGNPVWSSNQQAVRLVWDGLDRIIPGSGVRKDVWNDVAPSDLGEMAADLEMQNTFVAKKRSYEDISTACVKTAVTVTPIYGTNASMPDDQSYRNNSSYHSIESTGSYQTANTHCPSDASLNSGMQGLNVVSENGVCQAASSTSLHSMDSNCPQTEASCVNHQSVSVVQDHPQPSLGQYQAQPSFAQNQPQPSFAQNQPQPSFAQNQPKPSFAQNQPQPSFAQSQFQPSFAPNKSQPSFVPSQPQHSFLHSQPLPQVVPSQPQQSVAQNHVAANPLNQPQHLAVSAQPPPLSIPCLPAQPVVQSQTQLSSAGVVGAEVAPQIQQTQSQPQRQHDGFTSVKMGPKRAMLATPSSATSQPKNVQTCSPLTAAVFNLKNLVPQPQQQRNQPLSHINHAAPRPEVTVSTKLDDSAPSPAPYDINEAKANIMVFNAMAKMNQGGAPVAQASNSSVSKDPELATAPRSSDAVTSNLQVTGDTCHAVSSAPNGSSTYGSNGRVCRIQGCDDFAIARRPYCLKHSGNRQCEHEGCTKCAQGSTRFCIAHGGGRRCTFPGCDKGARDKYFCAAHGGGKRCSTEGCSKSAVGGSKLCTSHGGGRRCSVDGCAKSAQSSTNYCVKHGGGKKCSHSGCEKVARGRTLYCAAHGGGVRCKLEGCTRVAIGKMQLCRAHGGGSRSKPGELITKA